MTKQKILDGEISKEKVRCEVCGKEFEQITNTHLKTHGITFNEYREQFPNALLVSEDLRKKFSGAKLGKPLTEEHKQHIRDNQPDISGEKNGMYSKHHTEESKQKMSDAMLGKTLTEEHKQHLRDSSPHLSGEEASMFGKIPWNKGETKETNESVKECSEKLLGKPLTEEHKQHLRDSSPHISGENCSAYIDGTSFLPYCEKFDDDLKERVREFFNRKCYVCGKSEQEQIEEMIKDGKRPFKKLSVHHVNYDKMVCCNDVKPLFVPLCHSCHGKTQKDREYWEEFFMISLKCLTENECFLPKEANKN
jgi:hypothetical protein